MAGSLCKAVIDGIVGFSSQRDLSHRSGSGNGWTIEARVEVGQHWVCSCSPTTLKGRLFRYGETLSQGPWRMGGGWG